MLYARELHVGIYCGPLLTCRWTARGASCRWRTCAWAAEVGPTRFSCNKHLFTLTNGINMLTLEILTACAKSSANLE